MIKTFFFTGLLSCLLITSCGNNNESGTHIHEDGSSHSDHTTDTMKPAQQEFTVSDTTGKDSTITNEHTHKNGEKHSH